MKSRNSVSRRRERKIVKLYRKLARGPDERLERRLLCLQRAEANEIRKRNKPPIDMVALEANLRRADELLKAHESPKT